MPAPMCLGSHPHVFRDAFSFPPTLKCVQYIVDDFILYFITPGLHLHALRTVKLFLNMISSKWDHQLIHNCRPFDRLRVHSLDN